MPVLRGKKRPIMNDALGQDFGALLYDAFINILTVTKGAVYMCMSSSELDTLQTEFHEAGGKWSIFVIWAKNAFTLGRSDYQRQYEPILYGWKQGADHYWCGDRDQGDVWFFDKPARNDLHPTMKPVALVERAIRNSSKSRDIVLDPFGGSGTTLIAADHTGRRARLIELDPKYVDVIVYRWQDQHERLRDSRKFGGELRNGVRKDAIFRVMTAVKSGLVYFCLVFAAGFLLGTVRVIVLIPRLGELYSVFLELPIILSISWVGCQWTVHRFHVKEEIAPRSVMGIAAFGLLMFAELGLSVFGFGRSVAAHFAAYQSLPALLGLAGQIAFAIFPVAQLFRRL